jgi:hypothetical protein
LRYKLRIVTVYLGDSIPTHFWMHIRHLLRIQSDYQIDIVTSHRIDSKPINDPRLQYFVYNPQQAVSRILDGLVMDAKFRNGFWRFSLERLFAVTQHHLEFPNESLIHFESDVLPLRNFPFRSFEKLEKLAWSRVDSSLAVAAIVYSPNVDASKWLSLKMMTIVDSAHDTDDMRVLGEIFAKNSQMVDVLPSIPQPSSSLRNLSLNANEIDLISISSHFSKFDGIFDPAGIGIWLTGTEPRNSFGVTKKYDYKSNVGSKAFIDPGNVKYRFDSSGKLSFESEENSIQIYSLHIHSKNLKYFGEEFEKHIYEDTRRSISGKIQWGFSPQILLTLIVQNLEKGTLLRFLLWLPGLRRVKKLNFRRKH